MAKEKLLEDILADEVLARYLETMRNSIEFHQNPTFDMWWFRKHFAAVAHRHGIFHSDERRRYNLFFGLAQTRVNAAIKRLADNVTKNNVIRSTPRPLTPREPEQQLPLLFHDPAAARAQLRELRDRLAKQAGL